MEKNLFNTCYLILEYKLYVSSLFRYVCIDCLNFAISMIAIWMVAILKTNSKRPYKVVLSLITYCKMLIEILKKCAPKIQYYQRN